MKVVRRVSSTKRHEVASLTFNIEPPVPNFAIWNIVKPVGDPKGDYTDVRGKLTDRCIFIAYICAGIHSDEL